MQRPRP